MMSDSQWPGLPDDARPVLVEWSDHAFHSGPESEVEANTIHFTTCGFLIPSSTKKVVRIAQSWNQTNEEYEDILALDGRTVITTTDLGDL
jgi:hypothetical protein